MGAGEDRETDTVNVLGHGRGDDLLRGEPDALVDDLETGVPCPDGNLLGAVAVPVQAGFAHQQAQPGSELFAGGADSLAHLRQLAANVSTGNPHGSGNPCGRTVLTKDVTQCLGPLTGGDASPGSLQRSWHEVDPGLGVFDQPRKRGLGSFAPRVGGVAVSAPCDNGGGSLCLDVLVNSLDRCIKVGGERVGFGRLEPVDADHDVLAGLDTLAPQRMRGHQGRFHVARLDRRHRSTHLLHPVDLGPGSSREVCHLGLDNARSGEQVVVLEQV